MNLMTLTGCESGAVIFGSEQTAIEGFIVDWHLIDGIPRLFAGEFVGLGDGDDLRPAELTDYERKIAIAFAKNEGEKDPKPDKAWRNAEVLIVAFEDWQ